MSKQLRPTPGQENAGNDKPTHNKIAHDNPTYNPNNYMVFHNTIIIKWRHLSIISQYFALPGKIILSRLRAAGIRRWLAPGPGCDPAPDDQVRCGDQSALMQRLADGGPPNIIGERVQQAEAAQCPVPGARAELFDVSTCSATTRMACPTIQWGGNTGAKARPRPLPPAQPATGEGPPEFSTAIITICWRSRRGADPSVKTKPSASWCPAATCTTGPLSASPRPGARRLTAQPSRERSPPPSSPWRTGGVGGGTSARRR